MDRCIRLLSELIRSSHLLDQRNVFARGEDLNQVDEETYQFLFTEEILTRVK